MTKQLFEAIRSWTASVENFIERIPNTTDEQNKILKQIHTFGVDIRLRSPEAKPQFHALPDGDFLDWTQTPPKDSGDYWWWNGDPDSGPIHISVMYSGTSGTCFAAAGQYGWTEAHDVSDMKGYWMLSESPDLPVVKG